jgi:hypothetical protein
MAGPDLGDAGSGGAVFERWWTPVARAAARLELVADEEPGSMQHFTTAVLLGDLLARLHATFVVSVLAELEPSVAQRFAYTLVRTSGGGDWVSALVDCVKRLHKFSLSSDLHRLLRWSTSAPDSDDERRSFIAVGEELADLASRLQHGEAAAIGKQTNRVALFELLVQVRNKTVHGAYDSHFYAQQVAVLDRAIRWLLDSTPLWEADLLYVATPPRGRIMRGLAPTQAAALTGDLVSGSVAFRLREQCWVSAQLLRIRANDTFLANGSWRESDATAEFLCHSLAAAEPGQGTMRIALPGLARPPLPSVGQVVDRHYRILEVLGEGDDAVVYLACDTDENVEYVLKAFREPRETFDQRRAEFEALQRINHRSVPRVHEVHSWEDPFHLRFDYVPGLPLEHKRNEFAGDPAAVSELGVTLADALAAVHATGFVHRDVAPDNILIPDDPRDPIRLVDFDLVAPIGTVGVAGTSIYRPPESELGAPWTQASDLYSLAVVLFELLTQRLPYKSADGGGERELVEPSTDEKARFGPVIDVLLRAASSEPDARYSTASAFSAALQAAIVGGPRC